MMDLQSIALATWRRSLTLVSVSGAHRDAPLNRLKLSVSLMEKPAFPESYMKVRKPD